MTANGWFQILFFLALIFLVTKPMGVFMARVFNREQTFLDPILRPIERLLYRVTTVDEDSRDALDGVRDLDAPVQPGVDGGPVPDAAIPGIPAIQSAEVRCSQSRPTWHSTPPPRLRPTRTGKLFG